MNSLLPCPFCGKTAKEPADILGTCQALYCGAEVCVREGDADGVDTV